jgi:hypothetical protein
MGNLERNDDAIRFNKAELFASQLVRMWHNYIGNGQRIEKVEDSTIVPWERMRSICAALTQNFGRQIQRVPSEDMSFKKFMEHVREQMFPGLTV